MSSTAVRGPDGSTAGAEPADEARLCNGSVPATHVIEIDRTTTLIHLSESPACP